MKPRSDLILPVGELTWQTDAAFTVTLPDSRRKFKAEQLLNKVDLPDSNWLRPKWVSTGEKAHLLYNSATALCTIEEAIDTWNQSIQRNSLCWFRLIACLQKNLELIAPYQADLLPPSPATVFMTWDEQQQAYSFSLALIPCPDASLLDWANASAVLWQWLNKETFMRMQQLKTSYLFAAALYYCMAGRLVSKKLPRQEQFVRFWSGRTDKAEIIRPILQAALPESLKGEELTGIIRQMNQSLAQREDAGDAASWSVYIDDLFSVHRIAVLWEYEKRIELSLNIWLDHVQWAGQTGVSWNKISGIYTALKQPEKAIDTILTGLSLGQQDARQSAIDYLLVLFREASPSVPPHAHKLIAQAEKLCPEEEREFFRLQMAHLYGKYTNEKDQTLRYLEHAYTDDWNQLLRKMLMVRMYLINQPDLPKIGKICLGSIQTLETRYPPSVTAQAALIYFYLMHAIANFYAISRFNDFYYLKDAYLSFIKALDLSIVNNDMEMGNIAASWLLWIREYVIYFPPEHREHIELGIDAYLEINKENGIQWTKPERVPQVPWYDESLLIGHSHSTHPKSSS
jgi:hypothetical protein